MTCLIFSFILFAISCRKDAFSPQTDHLQKNKIVDSSIDKWYSDNPVSQIIPIDWKKARQTVIDGKHVVRVPTLNIDLIKASLNVKSPLKAGMLNSKGLVPKNKTALEQNPVIDDPGSGGNSNFFSAHPPEVYFVQDPLTSKMHTFVTNFIPDDQSTGFGQNGNWTGKLFEWNTSSDTVLVQTFVNNVLTDRSVRKFYKVNDDGSIEFSGPQKLQSLTPIKDKQVSGIFGWLVDKILDGLGAIGWLLGLTELEQSTSSSTGHHYHYRFVSHPSNSSGNEWDDTGIAGNQYVSMGLPLVSSYLSGMGSGTPEVEVTYSSYNYNGVNQNNSGPNNTVPNSAGIYVLEYITVSPKAQAYILSVEAIPVAETLKAYLDLNSYSTENRAFASWAVEYVYTNTNLTTAIEDYLQANPLERELTTSALKKIRKGELTWEWFEKVSVLFKIQNNLPRDKEPASYNWRNKLAGEDFSTYLTETTPFYFWNNDVKTVNPEAYNCHYYAFGIESAKLVDDEHPKWVYALDLSKWDEVIGPIHVGDRVLYFAPKDSTTKNGYTHSGIVTEVDADGYATKISSKMGTYQIIEHHPRDIPPLLGSSAQTFTYLGSTFRSRIYFRKKP